jgi:SAM-dependent MidA family methyltransferase
MQRALYGPTGFYRGASGPAAHFRTSVHASPLFARAIARLLREVDALLGRPDAVTLVDMAAGRGELLVGVLDELAAGDTGMAGRVRFAGVEVAERPQGLPEEIEWRSEPPDGIVGLLVANEWLDNVPCDVVEAAADGEWLLVEVARDGEERFGGKPDAAQQAWLTDWWPRGESGESREPSTRAEVGLTRDVAWRSVVASIDRGLAVAIDYAHTRDDRPPYGTMTGYREGRQVDPVPDGSCDVTCHVALDSCAEAAAPLVDWSASYTQRDALRALGISGARPPLARASSDPRGYLRALSEASSAAELTDPAGLGGFGWLVQGRGIARVSALDQAPLYQAEPDQTPPDQIQLGQTPRDHT